MKKLALLVLLILFACTKDSGEPETIIETVIEKPNVFTTVTQTSSSSCSLGGYDILVFDDANSNGSKDSGEELFLQKTICFEENRNLTTKIREATLASCEYGGLSIVFYDDKNNNEEVDEGEEVFYESEECYPRDANAKSYIVDAELEFCTYGGKSITFYDDLNGNDIPDEGETIFYQGVECYPDEPNVVTKLTPATETACPLGGYEIQVFNDSNSNGTKDADEVLYFQDTLCFEEVRNFKSAISELTSDTCEFGGLRIIFYDDTNDDNQVSEGEEVFYEGEECYPRDANVQTNITDAELAICPEGGRSITVYDDVNGNNTPDEGEAIFYQGEECYPNVDSDGDGVVDSNDLCPDTVAGSEVDGNGCAPYQRDTDGDGVTDDLDQCNDSQPDIPIDETGCPLSPVYLAENGVTVKAYEWAQVGSTGLINGFTYTVVDEPMLREMVSNGELVVRVCTSKVTNMNSLFKNYTLFNQFIGTWDVSNVTDMSYMFEGAVNFNKDLGFWDVSNVENMTQMFFNASIYSFDLSSWNVSKVFSCDVFGNPENFTFPSFINCFPNPDFDADGVINLFDLCENTPPGSLVNENGCSASQNGCAPTAGTWTIEMEDSYGDGWQSSTPTGGSGIRFILANGNSIEVPPLCSFYDRQPICIDGSNFGTAIVTIPEGTQAIEAVFPGDRYGEISFRIISPLGNILADYGPGTPAGPIVLDLCLDY